MSGHALIPERTARELKAFAVFFGIDIELNRHIFRHAAQADSRAFETVMHALVEAIEQDIRHGTTQRIREDMRNGKTRTAP